MVVGYSGTPLPRKLGIKDGHRVALVDAPESFSVTLGEVPAGVSLRRGLPSKGTLDVIMWFVSRRAELERRVGSFRRRMAPTTSVWIAWPKKASGVATDVTESGIREVVLPTGLVDNKVCAIDETWSGLRFVIRLVNRP